MKKKKILLIFLLGLTILLTACGKTTESKKEVKNKNKKEEVVEENEDKYLKTMDMATFEKASKSSTDDFVVFAYDPNFDNEQYIINEVKDYISKNKRVIYFLDITDFANEKVKNVTEREKKTYYERYKKDICSKFIEDPLSYYTEEDCEEDFDDVGLEDEIRMKFFEDHYIDDEDVCALMYFHNSSILDTFNNYIPYGAFSVYKEDKQQEVLEEANERLHEWLDKVYALRDEKNIKDKKIKKVTKKD